MSFFIREVFNKSIQNFISSVLSSAMEIHQYLSFPLHLFGILIIICHFFLVSQILAEEADNYIVHMDLSEMPSAFSGQHHNHWYLATLASVSEEISSSSKLIYSYTHVINGFSARLTPVELESLKNTRGFLSATRDLPVQLDTTRSIEFMGLTSRSEPWKLSNMGEGMIIGMVDTGIWPESESFKDDGVPEPPITWKGKCQTGTRFNSSMCNRKLIGAQYFNKGLIAKYPNITIEMNSARDTGGHGTHTSSTAAGNFVDGVSFFGYAPGTVKGAAPMAHLAMYKPISTADEGMMMSDLLAAIDQAISDGVDVISMSLGLNRSPLYEDVIAIASLSAIGKNIFVSTSAGNHGPNLKTLHNGTPWVLTVAAGTLDRELGGFLKLGNGDSVFGLSLYPGNFTASELPLVFMGSCLSEVDLFKVGHKIVVCEDRNGSLLSVVQQTGNAELANVSGAVFITNATFDVLEKFVRSSYPVLFVKIEDGTSVLDYIKSTERPLGTMEFGKTRLGVRQAPVVAGYSSRGPSQTCPFVLKPDVMAPGDLVLAAWSPEIAVAYVKSGILFSKFHIISGTSMACPHAAGVAALIKKAHPEWSPAAIRSAMMTTADTMDHLFEPIRDIGYNTLHLADPLGMGSGEINPTKALDPGLVYDLNMTDYTRLICALNFTEKQIKTITRSSNPDCSSPSRDLNYPSFVAFFDSYSSESTTVREFHRTVTNVGEARSSYTASVTPIPGLNVNVVPDKLVFEAKNQKLSYKVVITVQEPAKMEEEDVVSYRYLRWTEERGKYVVKSPIVATSLSSEMNSFN